MHIMASTTDEKTAKANRLRLLRNESERAMREVLEQGLAIRKNMARLRELRLAKEAETASVTEADSTVKLASPAKGRVSRQVD